MQTTFSDAESKRQFEQVAQQLPMAVAILDRDLRYIFTNERWILDFHLGQESLIGKNHYDVFPEISEDWKAIHQACLAGESHTDEEVAFQRLDGSIDWLRRDIRPWYRDDEAVGGLIMYISIINEQKKARDELQAERWFLRQVIDLNTSFIFAKDIDGRYTLVNKALADWYGSKPEEMVGKYDENYNSQRHETEHFRRDDLEVVRERKTKFIPEEPVSSAEGTTRWYQTIKVPLISGDGDSVQLLGIATDITERKHAEEQLQKLVIQEQEARQVAETASKMKDLFLANMSHELRTPLNAIIGFLREMMYSQQLDPDNTHMAERCLANSKRLNLMVNSVLDLSRLAVGSLELVIMPVDLNELGHYIHEDLSIQAKEKGLQFGLEIDPKLPKMIQHDEERLTQIISNLLVNAIKYTSEGQVKLALKQVGDKLIIEVSDTGIGIPSEMQSAIFEDFTQVQKQAQNQGVGLGLSIVKNLTDLMNGRVILKSEPHDYTIFTVELPLNLQDDGDIKHG